MQCETEILRWVSCRMTLVYFYPKTVILFCAENIDTNMRMLVTGNYPIQYKIHNTTSAKSFQIVNIWPDLGTEIKCQSFLLAKNIRLVPMSY